MEFWSITSPLLIRVPSPLIWGLQVPLCTPPTDRTLSSQVICCGGRYILLVPRTYREHCSSDGLNKTANEVIIVIEAYRTLRDRGPYPADQVVKDLNGKFAFILYDCSSKLTFVASDTDGNVPFFWGTDSDGNLVFSDDAEVVKKGCGKSFAPFPKGCFFTSSGGLRSYEHPLNALKAMPRVDSSGQVCGATFKVDEETKKESSIPRVGSAANWSSQI
uniref:DUF3700 domain-containing protein n=1 Tax=Nelumbo nucifera TaxID=4432 RepID=A0A822ZST8_NELNU|nr:TPA_asm: hypothetical protein HUJ06_017884 [Nelumbo nucifera]